MWRKELLPELAKDEGLRKEFLEAGFLQPRIIFNSLLWTYNPRMPTGMRNLPFILRPKQAEVVADIKCAIDTGHNLAITKSRDEGATELLMKLFAIYWWLSPDFVALVGSRKEELVDKAVEVRNGVLVGSHKCLFHKIVYTIHNLPSFLQPQYQKTHMQFQNLENSSMISGESTNTSFGIGDRASVVGVDEVAAIDPTIAQSIIDNINDTSDCCIFNSTHWNWGAAHPYYRLLISNRIKVAVLGWEHNPEKRAGLYRSPAPGIVDIEDYNYYLNRFPRIFKDDRYRLPFRWEEVKERFLNEGVGFIADGGEENFGCPRSPWFDKEEKRRSKRDLAKNVLRIPAGSSEMIFDYATLMRLKNNYVKAPNYYGDIKYEMPKKNVITKVQFEKQGSAAPLKWWGELIKDRPNQKHNYVVACDISRGTGASNSVAAIVDVNTSELVGLYVNPNIGVTDFAELTVALCRWVGGGTQRPFLIWEANGPGDSFGQKIGKLNYGFIYYKEDTRSRSHKKTKRWGWDSTKGPNGTKAKLLWDLDSALMESIRKEKHSAHLTIYDEALINELESYVWFEGRADVGPSDQQLDDSGATAAHGDRVIATGLAVLGTQGQPAAAMKYYKEHSKDSIGGRIETRKLEKQKEKKRFLW
jgi:hypothetical protein